MYDVTVFFSGSDRRDRIEAPEGHLQAGKWVFPTATRYRLDSSPETLSNFELATQTTFGDLSLQGFGRPRPHAAGAVRGGDDDAVGDGISRRVADQPVPHLHAAG